MNRRLGRTPKRMSFDALRAGSAILSRCVWIQYTLVCAPLHSLVLFQSVSPNDSPFSIYSTVPLKADPVCMEANGQAMAHAAINTHVDVNRSHF